MPRPLSLLVSTKPSHVKSNLWPKLPHANWPIAVSQTRQRHRLESATGQSSFATSFEPSLFAQLAKMQR